MTSMRRQVIAARNALWRNIPAVGRAEIGWRRRKLDAALWDLRLLSLLPESTGTALDVGANIGVYTSVLARRFARVHAFEPNPSVARRLAAAAPGNVTVWPLALSNVSGSALLHVPLAAGGEVSGLGTIEPVGAEVPNRAAAVQAVTLDSLDLGPVELVKIDVEGHEMAVLEGARRVLSSASLRAVLVEAEDRHTADASRMLFELMRGTDFDGFFAFEGELLAVDDFDAARHQVVANLSRPPSYSNMFLFIRRGDEELTGLAQTAARDVCR